MIFISGVHGVGKSYFCDLVKKKLGIDTFTAKELKKNGSSFILDGHFCLLDVDGIIKRIPRETFEEIKPDFIVLLTEKPEVISMRREKRDGIKIDVSEIKKFQDAEIDYAKEIANHLDVELIISSVTEDIDSVIDFVRRCN